MPKATVDTLYDKGYDKLYDNLNILNLMSTINKLEAGLAAVITAHDHSHDIIRQTKNIYVRNQTIFENDQDN